MYVDVYLFCIDAEFIPKHFPQSVFPYKFFKKNNKNTTNIIQKSNCICRLLILYMSMLSSIMITCHVVLGIFVAP